MQIEPPSSAGSLRVGFWALFAVILLGPLGSEQAQAHAVGIEARLKDGQVIVEAFFDDDTPVREGKVRVEDEAKIEIAAGKTDRNGHWAFPIPSPGKYRILLDAGDGHRTSVSVRIPDTSTESPAPSKLPARVASTSPKPESPGSGVVTDGPTRDEFTRLPIVPLLVGLAILAILGFGLPRLRRAK